MRISDWSSDVCSSDLVAAEQSALPGRALVRRTVGAGEKRLGAGEGARPVGIDAIECPCTGQRLDLPPAEPLGVDTPQIGRGTCRERVSQYVEIWVAA